MKTSSELVNIVLSYNKHANVDLIKTAYLFAMESHAIQKRASGAPYFQHPVEVATYLASQLHMDVPTIVTGLLHDVLEDTNVCCKELEEIFDSEIAFLVEGVTKLSKVSYTSSHKNLQAENFRRFMVALSQDIRVLVVKLVDRLHNMKTLNYISSLHKRRRIALETLEIYAPLAERIGMNIIKDEIEDIAFYSLHPNEYATISTKLKQYMANDSNFVDNTISELKKIFEDKNIPATIVGRQKKPYSIWKKMQKHNTGVEQINDIIAFRIIVKTIEQCYIALGLIHTNFSIMPGRFKDYISIPKLNNYRSLHTTVIGPFKQPIEIQIRTEEMHKAAEEGIAAHWSYKNGDIAAHENESRNYEWIKSIITILKNSESSHEVMNNSKKEMFEDEVFCFTTKGDLITLPKGATAVDFAYKIHTDVGNTCIGVRINGKMSPLKSVLRNGDRVDILNSAYQHPEASWANFAVTGKALSCIKKFVRSQEKSEFTALGMQLMKYMFANANIDFSEELINPKHFKCSSLNSLYFNLGKGGIPLNNIKAFLSSFNNSSSSFSNAYIRLIDFVPGIAIHFSECCSPVLGDKIIGILEPKKGLMIHTTRCNQIKNCNKDAMIKVSWNQDEHEVDASFFASLRIEMVNKPDSFASVTNIISSNGASIANLKIEGRSIDFFTLLIDIQIIDIIHLSGVQAALRACSYIKSVTRV